MDENKSKRIGYYMKMIAHSMENMRNKTLEKIGLTSSQFEILLYLCFKKDEEINQRDLEKNFKLSNPTVNGILNRLEYKGFIIREMSEKDARCKNIKVTNEAYYLYKKMKTIAKNMENDLTKGITKEEKEAFINVIKKMYDNICK